MGKWALAALSALCVAASPEQPSSDNPIKIGALLAVSGPAANLGRPEARTLLMLVDDLNNKGGIHGRKIELIIKNTGANPQKAVELAKELIQKEKVFAIIGPSTSGETMAVKEIADEGKTLLISCAAAEAIVHPVARYVFKTPQNDTDAIIKILKQMNKMEIKSIGVLSSQTGFGQAGKEQIVKLAPSYGIRILVNETYDKDAEDLSSQAARLQAAGVEAVINWSVEPAQALVLKHIRRVGLKIPIFQSHGFGNIQYVKTAGAAAEGVIFPGSRLLVADALPDTSPHKALLQSYKKQYEGTYDEPVSSFGGYARDAFTILSRAIREAGDDREKVRDAIENTSGLAGTAGVFDFSSTDHSGLDIESFEMLTVKDGRFIPLPK